MSSPPETAPKAPLSQAGLVLLLCLLFLTTLSLLGMAASAESIMQKRLARNLKEAENGRQTALAAQRRVEEWLLQMDDATPEGCLDNCAGSFILAKNSLPPRPEFENQSWWDVNGYRAEIDPLSGERWVNFSSDLINSSRWIIETIHEAAGTGNEYPGKKTWYRVLVRANGTNGTSVSVIESIVVRSRYANGRTEVSATNVSRVNPAKVCQTAISAPECGRVAWRKLL